jgi:hypothetical protein
MDPGGGLIHVLPGSGSFSHVFFSPPQEQAFYAMGLKEFRWAFERLPLGTGGPQLNLIYIHVYRYLSRNMCRNAFAIFNFLAGSSQQLAPVSHHRI